MANIDIDTTTGQYTQLVNGIDTLRTVMMPRLRLFKKMPLPVKRQWLQRDALLRKTLRLMRDGSKYIDMLSGDDVA